MSIRKQDGSIAITPTSESSTGFVGRALEAVRSSIGVVSRAISVSLPPALQKLLDGRPYADALRRLPDLMACERRPLMPFQNAITNASRLQRSVCFPNAG